MLSSVLLSDRGGGWSLVPPQWARAPEVTWGFCSFSNTGRSFIQEIHISRDLGIACFVDGLGLGENQTGVPQWASCRPYSYSCISYSRYCTAPRSFSLGSIRFGEEMNNLHCWRLWHVNSFISRKNVLMQDCWIEARPSKSSMLPSCKRWQLCWPRQVTWPSLRVRPYFWGTESKKNGNENLTLFWCKTLKILALGRKT